MSAHLEAVEEPTSDYEQIGGAAAVRAVVDRFYDLLLGDERLTPYFDGIDLPRLKRHQVLLISQVLGGPAAYDGRELREAHDGMGIDREAFSLVVTYLVQALQEAGVPDDVIGRVGQTLAATEDDVVAAAG